MATKKKDEYQNVKNGTGPADVGPGTKHDSFLALMGKAPSATGTTAPAYTPTAAPTFKPQDNPWYQQAQQIMGQIQNRGPFQFNLNENALYQQYKDNYMKQGQQAMMDTMGQASGLTGGYGSSYAQNVGQQAYNDYLTKLGDIVPELYAQERAAYDAEGNDLYQMLSAARGMYDTDYGIWRDQVGDARYQDELDYARSRDAISDQRYQDELAYGRQRDTLNDLWRQREYDDSRADLLYNRRYQEGRDALSDSRYAEELAYGRSRDQLSDQRYEREYNDSRSDAVYSRVMQQISSGYMPSAEELQAAGISQGYARYLVNLYAQQQAAAAQGSTGGRGSSGGSSGGGYGGGSGGGGGGGGDVTDPSPNVSTDLGTTVDGNPVEAMPAGYDVITIRNYCMGAGNQGDAKQRLNRFSRYLTAEQYNAIYRLILGGWGPGNYLV